MIKLKTYYPYPFAKKHFKIVQLDPSGSTPLFDIDKLKAEKKKIVLQVDGGGIKGVMDAYALYVVEASSQSTSPKKLHDAIDAFYGTSTGAIIASQLALGLTAKEILEFYVEQGPDIFKQNFLFGGIYDSVFNPKKLLELLRQKLGSRTFEELWKETGKELTIVVMEANKRETWFCNHTNTPNMVIADAVMGSTCVPLIFPPHVYKGRAFYDGFIGGYASAAGTAAKDSLEVRGWKPEDFLLVSLGTGAFHPDYSTKKMKHMCKMDNVEWTIGGIIEGMTEQQVSKLQEYKETRKLNYVRWDVRLTEGTQMADDDTDAIPTLLKLAEKQLPRAVTVRENPARLKRDI